MSLIPQKDRWKQIIKDLSFPLFSTELKRGSKPIQSIVNKTT